MEEEILSLIIHGCKLARNLESHLPHLSTITQPPNVLSDSCEEILRVFQSVVNRLMSLSTDRDHHHLHPHPSSILSSMNIAINNIIPHDQVDHPRPVMTELDASVQEWLKCSYAQAIETAATAAAQFSSISNDIVDHVHHHRNPFSCRMLLEQEQQQQTVPELGLEMPMLFVNSNNIIRTSGSAGGSQNHHQSAVHHHESTTVEEEEEEGSQHSGNIKTTTTTTTTTSPTHTPVMVQRSRKRKDGVDKRTVRVAGPRFGNMEIPPDDGFTWRKYGQKEILGSMFPRGYYRCTHKNFFGCEAKKQVQRLDLDPNTFEVTYYGIHTCQMGGMTSMGGGGPPFSSSSSSSQVLLPDDRDQYHSNMVVELVDAMFNTAATATNSTSGGGRGGEGTSSNNIISKHGLQLPLIPEPGQAHHQQQQQHQLQQHHQQHIT